MEDRKTNIIESYRKELQEIHPSLPAYFYATSGYIIPWPKNDEDIVNRFLLERVDPNGEVDYEVLDELIRIWAQESWFGLASHPPLAFMLLKRKLSDPNSKLSKLLNKGEGAKEESEKAEKLASTDEVLRSILGVQPESEPKTAAKTRKKRGI